MADASRRIATALFAALIACSVAAQQSPTDSASASKASPAPQDVEPAVNTSASSASPAAESAASSTAAPAPSTPSVRPKKSPAAKNAAPAAQAATSAAEEHPKSGAKDRMALDATQITGNRELPKVLYIVPWKHADLSDLAGRPSNSLLDEVLAPVDRDVFRRENRYYEALQPDAGRAGNAPAPAATPPARDEK
jgi:hypothetical protein